MGGHQILVVEDNEKNMKLLRDVLRATGHRLLEAASGGQAVALAREHLPDIVLMDIQLPDMNGIEALAQLRSDPRTASIPVLAVTAQAMKGDRERFIGEGFDAYLSKPIDIDELLTTVGEHARASETGAKDQ
jgi:two-component system cell cycle response regulator DivK